MSDRGVLTERDAGLFLVLGVEKDGVVGLRVE
jgi:hypothetical protein